MNIETFFNNTEAKRFYYPSKLIVSRVSHQLILELINNAHDKVCVLYDKTVEESNLLKSIKNGSGNNVVFEPKSGSPFVEDVGNFHNSNGIFDIYVAIGGGSTLDFAKALIMTAIYGDFDGVGMNDKRGMKVLGSKKPLFIAAPTTAGSGAESSRYYVTYRKSDHGKVHGKSWNSISDWTFLDPDMLRTIPKKVQVITGFDVFLHLFESYITVHESSPINDMISLYWIPKLLISIQQLALGKEDDVTYENLAISSSLAGAAISNVRTGNIHEAAGALLERVDLSHGETLYVFFESALKQYEEKVNEKINRLLKFCTMEGLEMEFDNMDGIISFWNSVFSEFEIIKDIENAVNKNNLNKDDLISHILDRMDADKVWNLKESPIILTPDLNKEMVTESLQKLWRYRDEH